MGKNSKHLTVYSDLNCPFCFIFNEWLIELGKEDSVFWQGVEHEPQLTHEDSKDETYQKKLKEEIIAARSRGEGVKINIPPFRSSSGPSLAALEWIRMNEPEKFNQAKKSLFRALWVEGKDIGNIDVLHSILSKLKLDLKNETLDFEKVRVLTQRWRSRKWDRIPMAAHPSGKTYLGLGNRKALGEFLEFCRENQSFPEFCAPQGTFNQLDELITGEIISDAPVMIHVLDAQGRIQFVSDFWLETLGYEREEVVGRNPIEFLTQASREKAKKVLPEFLKRGTSVNINYQFIRKDGKIRDIVLSGKIRRNLAGNPNGAVGFLTDVTEKKRQQLELIQSSKLASLGEMAAGIAHEINNPLAILLGFSKRLQMLHKKGSKEGVEEIYTRIDDTIERIAKIVRAFNKCARKQDDIAVEPIELGEIIHDTLAICQQRFKNSDIDLKVIGDLSVEVECVPVEISQVLVNLLLNSLYAVRNQKKKWVKIEVEDLGNCSRIRVSDSGSGIAEENKQKIFDPFFTTKPVGSGTGIGLSISRRIVEQCGGKLYLDQDSEDTCFIIELLTGKTEILKAAA